MATAVDNVNKELQILDASENITLNDAERVKRIAVMKEKKCLWGSEKYTRAEKQAALKELEEAFDSLHTSSELLSVWKSLRASMLREVKTMRKEPETRSCSHSLMQITLSLFTFLSSSSRFRPSIKRSKLTKF